MGDYYRDHEYQETEANDSQLGRVVVLPDSSKIGAIVEILPGTKPVMASIRLIDGTEITHEFFSLLNASIEQTKQFYSIQD